MALPRILGSAPVFPQETRMLAPFTPSGNGMRQMAGMVFRFQNASNFYVVRASALGHNVRFYKMVDGVRAAQPSENSHE